MGWPVLAPLENWLRLRGVLGCGLAPVVISLIAVQLSLTEDDDMVKTSTISSDGVGQTGCEDAWNQNRTGSR